MVWVLVRGEGIGVLMLGWLVEVVGVIKFVVYDYFVICNGLLVVFYDDYDGC